MIANTTIKLLKEGEDPIIYWIDGGFTDNGMAFVLRSADGVKQYDDLANGISYFTNVLLSDKHDIFAYIIKDSVLEFLNNINNLRVNKNLSPIKIIKSSTKTFTIIADDGIKNLRINNVFMNRELMSEDEIMTEVKAKVCRALRCNDPDMIIIDIDNLTIKMRNLINNYKIIYPDGKYKRKTLKINHSRENVLMELVKDEPLIQIARIIKKGDNRYNVYVIQKVSQRDTLEKMSDYTQLDATSPITPRAGKKSKRNKKSKRGKKSKRV